MNVRTPTRHQREPAESSFRSGKAHVETSRQMHSDDWRTSPSESCTVNRQVVGHRRRSYPARGALLLPLCLKLLSQSEREREHFPLCYRLQNTSSTGLIRNVRQRYLTLAVVLRDLATNGARTPEIVRRPYPFYGLLGRWRSGRHFRLERLHLD